MEEVEGRGRKVKARVEEWADDVAEEVREGRRTIERTANSARDELERRLADARARRRAAVADRRPGALCNHPRGIRDRGRSSVCSVNIDG